MYRQRYMTEMLLAVGLTAVGLVLLLVITAGFFTALARALRRVSPENRRMEPGLMWLNVIPLVHFVWNFFTTINVAEALRNEFYDRGWGRRDEDFGHGIGMAMSILQACAIIPYCGGLFGLAGFVCFIIYWVKIAGYSSQLASRAYGGYADDYDYDDRDDYDDRRGRRDHRDRDRDEEDDHEVHPWDRGGR